LREDVTIEHFPDPTGLPPTSGYSHVVAGDGRVIAISGQLPLDADGRLVGGSDPLLQAEQVFANLRRALQVAGATSADVVRLGFFLLDLGDLAQIRLARDRFLGAGPPPASSLVQVSGLVVAGARIEVDALAAVASNR
jgi:enamine deaminase RidA (YjgF/YER057c/UK114 family)